MKWQDKRVLLRGCWFPTHRMVEVELIYEPRDLWLGVFWKTYPQALEFYVCLLPVRIYIQQFTPYKGYATFADLVKASGGKQ